MPKNNLKHGMTGTREYETWVRIKSRCSAKKGTKHYEYYVSRGITVCDRWINSFENFYSDMGNRPEGYEIDRIDNSKGYSPENCRWVTRSEQMKNRTRVKPAWNKGIPMTDSAKKKSSVSHKSYFNKLTREAHE